MQISKVITLKDYEEAPHLLVVQDVDDDSPLNLPDGYRVFHIAEDELPNTFKVPGHGYAQPWNHYTVLREDCKVVGSFEGIIPQEMDVPADYGSDYIHEGSIVALLSIGKYLAI